MTIFPRRQKAAWGILLAFVGAGLAIGILAVLQKLNLETPLYSGAAFGAAAVAVAISASRRKQSLLGNPIYVAFFAYVLFIGIGPLLAQLAIALAPRSYPVSEVGWWPVMLSWIGLLALLIGYGAGRGKRGRRSIAPSVTTIRGASDLEGLRYGGILLTAVGVVGLILYVQHVGGFSYFLNTPYGTRDNPSIYAGFYYLLRPGLYLLVAWATASGRYSVRLSIFLLLYAAFDLLWFGPLNGTRQHMVMIVLVIACVRRFCSPTQGNTTSLFLVPARWLFVLALLAAIAWGTLRARSVSDLLASSPSDLNMVEGAELATSTAFQAPFDGFVSVVNLVPNIIPYQMGSTFYEAGTVFIPRALWSGKPSSVADWLTDVLYGGGAGNSVVTWPGELYLNFGTLGIVAGMIGLGWTCGLIGRLNPTVYPAASFIRHGLFYSICAALPLVWIWGGSNTVVWYFLTDIGPALGILSLISWFRASSGSCSLAMAAGRQET